jgi:serine/threonine-protein kinase
MTEVLGARSERAGRTSMLPGMGAGPTTQVGGRRPSPDRPRPGVPQHIRRRRAQLAIAVVALLVVTIAAIGWWLGSGRWTSVPELMGKQQDVAINLIQGAGLAADCCTQQWSESVPAGEVIATRPATGSAIRGSNVRLVVSRGPERFRVDPALVNQPEEKVTATLQQSLPEIQVTTEQRFDNAVKAGLVIGFTPPAGSDLKRGQVVTMLVSKGHDPVAVPDVTGQTPEQATSNLKKLGFAVARAADGRSAAVGVGKVMAVTPLPSAGQVAFGSTVTIQVSAGVPQVAVPDVTGKSAAEAAGILTKLGLKVGATTFFGDHVRRQAPDAGTVVDVGSTVRILVSF